MRQSWRQVQSPPCLWSVPWPDKPAQSRRRLRQANNGVISRTPPGNQGSAAIKNGRTCRQSCPQGRCRDAASAADVSRNFKPAESCTWQARSTDGLNRVWNNVKFMNYLPCPSCSRHRDGPPVKSSKFSAPGSASWSSQSACPAAAKSSTSGYAIALARATGWGRALTGKALTGSQSACSWPSS
jgi:hypothetical protein